MPESSSPFDDPFADLFGQLPDPKQRDAQDRDAATGTPAASAPPALSRRAARAAAAPASTTSASAPSPRPTAPRVPAPASSAPHADPAADSARTRPGMRTAVATAPVPTAELEDLFLGSRSTDDIGTPPPRPPKRRRRIGGWIALGIVLVLLGGIAGGGIWVWNTYQVQIRKVMGWTGPTDYAAGQANGEVLVTIASGDTGRPISQALYDAGVTLTPTAFYDHLIATAQNPPFVPGIFKLQKQMTSTAALAALLDPANKVEKSAQLREGLTVAQSLPVLADGTGIPLADLQTAVATPSTYGVTAKTLEGWLFPATYAFNPGVTAQQVIKTLVDRTVQSLDAAKVPAADRERILTIASIIQREARFTADFYKVSRVIQNRLNPSNQETFGLLQMDSTAQYGYGENHSGSASTSAAAQTDPNPWNTYVHPGLPIGPIANPGDTAIDAAMHPVDGPWLYFVTVNLNTGETVFTTNIADHQKAVAQWQAWCTANPNAGC